ncbi:MAG: N-methyl-D-aspartate receptor NMDAR2C subunit [bacterium]|nr:N-methyl-D-aspartate receptor NMDAR2C subunit [bacterium]
MEPMLRKWLRFWRETGARGDPLPVFRGLVRRYSEPHRRYHALAHIRHCLREFEVCRTLAHDPIAIEFAIWFHDTVYDTRRSDNEARSAKLAHLVIAAAGLPQKLGIRVGRLIRATKHHPLSIDADVQLFLDVDLSILGQDERQFRRYERQIRQEYAWVPPERFAYHRTTLLRKFLKRPSVFGSEFFRDQYETRARRTLEYSLRTLEKK